MDARPLFLSIDWPIAGLGLGAYLGLQVILEQTFYPVSKGESLLACDAHPHLSLVEITTPLLPSWWKETLHLTGGIDHRPPTVPSSPDFTPTLEAAAGSQTCPTPPNPLQKTSTTARSHPTMTGNWVSDRIHTQPVWATNSTASKNRIGGYR